MSCRCSGASCPCSSSAGCSHGSGTVRFAPPGEITHFSGDQFCPDCGGRFDGSTGYCPACEGPLELYHVAAFSAEWLAHTEGPPPRAPSVTVSRRNVADAVRLLLADGEPRLVTIQRQD